MDYNKCMNRFRSGEYSCLNCEKGISCSICKRNICLHCAKTGPSLIECSICSQKVCAYEPSFLTSCPKDRCGRKIKENFYCEQCITTRLEQPLG